MAQEYAVAKQSGMLRALAVSGALWDAFNVALLKLLSSAQGLEAEVLQGRCWRIQRGSCCQAGQGLRPAQDFVTKGRVCQRSHYGCCGLPNVSTLIFHLNSEDSPL